MVIAATFGTDEGTSLEVQRLRLCTSTAGAVGSIPGGGTKILKSSGSVTKKVMENTDHLPRASLYSVHILTPLILTTPLGGDYFPTQFTDGETEAQKGSATHSGW